LQDVLGTGPGGLFVAFIRGKKYNEKMVYYIDPHGALFTEPEEVALMTWDDNNWGIWAAFHYSHEYASGQATGKQRNRVVDLEHHKLDTTFEKSARLRGDATTTFTARYEGVRVIPFDLFRTLRVSSVTGGDGQNLAFIQEDKDHDPDFYAILPKPLAKGERYTIRTVYEGKEAVSNEGGGNYFPVARTDWYPNAGFKDYATYDLTFRFPKGMELAATGVPVREIKEGNQTISEWRSEIPLAVAGFNFGDMRRKEVKLEKEGVLVGAFANEAQPDWMSGLSGGTVYQVDEGTRDPFSGASGNRVAATGAVGTMNTTSLMDRALAEGQVSVQLFSDYFGALPYKRVAITQQTACNFGQAWPGLVYLPLCSFLDSTTLQAMWGQFVKNPRDRHRLAIYFKEVTPHEVAHQWWGHTVGWSGYRDQWMSEGFATQSASLFLQLIRKDEKGYREYWDDQRQQLIDRNPEGYRPIDSGPVTMGYRVNTTKTGFNNYSELVYPKGGYILHMLRMLMFNRQTGDQAFKTMMRDFVKTYTNQLATTEDFKAMVEKHMTPEMDLDGNRRMDWFFNQYVYGTALPHYAFEQSSVTGSDGKPGLSFKVTQSNVDPQFKMIVTIYADFGSGKVGRLGTLALTGNSSQDAQVPMSMFKDKPKRLVLNYYNDVLCTQEAK
ncbi:MAG: M1 family metallopeptidase, partial [Terriglobales bacterium]